MLKIICILALVASTLTFEETTFFRSYQEKHFVSSIQLSFFQSYATCKRYGWTLATERSASETENVNAAISASTQAVRSYWIGGFRQNSNDFLAEWIWLDQGEYFTYTKWRTTGTTTSECLLKGPSSSAHNWTSAACTGLNYFICQA